MSEVTEHGNYHIVKHDVNVYVFETVGGSFQVAQPGILPIYRNTRSLMPFRIGNYEIVPHGEQNNLPDELRQILDENNLTPEILNKQAQLLWGQGPGLYKVIYENGRRRKYYESNPEIEAWLKSWDFESYLLKATVEFRHMNGHFTRYFRNRAPRIGGPGRIEYLEHVSCINARLEWPNAAGDILGIITGDFDQPWKYGLARYPIFNRQSPFSMPVSMSYSNMYSFALPREYSRTSYFGSLNWIKLSSSIAKLLSSFNANSAAIKYHIRVPRAYWNTLQSELIEKCERVGITYTDSLLDKAKREKFSAFAATLTNTSNVGKFITTDDFFDDEANEYVGWKVDVLDQKVKDFIDAQINVSKRAALETTAGLGLHPALSNISYEGNLPSGSEQLYAFKLYLLTGVDIPESIVCRDINNAIQANFPGTDLRIGFYHDVVMTEESTSPKDRIKNNGSGGSSASASAMVKCSGCGLAFDYNSITESGMGYVNCPACKTAVTQKNAL